MAKPESGADRENVPQSVERNISSIAQWRAARRSGRSASERIANAISAFAGSMPFVYIHLVAFGCWIIANLGWVPGVPQWDPTLVVLAMTASVEAIFLSTFVLINQNQMTAESDEKADLDLQVNLLNERETTRLIAMTQAIADHLGVDTGVDQDLSELRRDTQPDVILEAVERGRDQDKN